MRLLLDTHALLWWFTDDARLSVNAKGLISESENEILVSSASAWEIATKHRLGKLEHAAEAVVRFDELVTADGFLHLSVSYRHALRAGDFRVDHRDPFDRMLAAQSELEGAPLLTMDAAFRQFGTVTLW